MAKLDPRLYDNDWRALERKARWSLILWGGLIFGLPLVLLLALKHALTP